MGFTNKKVDRIKRYILENIHHKNKSIASKVSKNFGISLTTVYRYIKDLEKEGIISKANGIYTLKETAHYFEYKVNKKERLEEDVIYKTDIYPFIKDLPANVIKIWQYAFTEMMNNAIDHSESDIIAGVIARNYLNTNIAIIDIGIGIFEKIRSYYEYNSIDDAVLELFKGKLTTDSGNHSGEGIFFTSRMVDIFGAMSDGKIFTHNKYADFYNDIESVPSMKKYKNSKGTTIVMFLANFSCRQTKEVFDMFSDIDGGFTKTQIPISKVFSDDYPVSRSQAKRLCSRFEDFSEIILDFEGVGDIGQGFAHELFVVFKRNHPSVQFAIINANEDVSKMIKHVEVSAKKNIN